MLHTCLFCTEFLCNNRWTLPRDGPRPQRLPDRQTPGICHGPGCLAGRHCITSNPPCV